MRHLLSTELRTATLGQFMTGWVFVITALNLLDALERLAINELVQRELLSDRVPIWDLAQIANAGVVIALIFGITRLRSRRRAQEAARPPRD